MARSKTRLHLRERYRTLLGHFRHELGHYFFDRLVVPSKEKHRLCKQVFGDDRTSYAVSLKRHYSEGPPQNWRDSFISEYATMHPWEDWAETWAHYMHIIDTMESIDDSQLALLNSKITRSSLPLATACFDNLLDSWMEYSVVLNSLNRSMGLQDAYPFVLTAPVRQKLNFIHQVIFDRLDRA